MKSRFNIYDCDNLHEEGLSLADLRDAGCNAIVVLARDHEAGVIRVECELPAHVTFPRELSLAYATLDESKPRQEL